MNIQEAAEILEQHIRRSGLKAGDRYITAKDAGKLLGKSVMTAQRAMTLLAQRKLLERRPKAGTFIAKSAFSGPDLKCVHILLPEQFTDGESFWEQVHTEIGGMKSVLPHLSVQFNFIPNQDINYTRQIVDKARDAGVLSGVIVNLSSRAMRAYFNASDIPAVIEGNVEMDLKNLSWLSWDQRQTGRVLAEYLFGRGHTRLATIMRDIWSIGEHHLHDGVGEAMAAAGLMSNALRIRSTPSERAATLDLAHSLLSDKDDFPTGILCRNESQADCVREVAQSLGLGERVEVVLCNTPFSNHAVKYACVVPDLDGRERGRIIGEMLRDQMENKFAPARGCLVGVRLRQADN